MVPLGLKLTKPMHIRLKPPPILLLARLSSGLSLVAQTATSADLRIPVLNNCVLSALAGVCWYFQFFFYTMGSTQMRKHDFASWTLYMASIIIFSTMWRWIFHEWKGASGKAHHLIAAGIATPVLSIAMISAGVGWTNQVSLL